MGEYAKFSGHEIKIGTCENMYYLRFEDRYKVTALRGNVNPVNDVDKLRFRLPFPDEDNIQPGGYKDHLRGERLYTKNDNGHYDDFSDPALASFPGRFQLKHDRSGLLISVPCYHGIKLPDLGPDASVAWNGKSWSLELSQLRPIKVDDDRLRVFPIVRCRHCGASWRYEWKDIKNYIPQPMRNRLISYMNED